MTQEGSALLTPAVLDWGCLRRSRTADISEPKGRLFSSHFALRTLETDPKQQALWHREAKASLADAPLPPPQDPQALSQRLKPLLRPRAPAPHGNPQWVLHSLLPPTREGSHRVTEQFGWKRLSPICCCGLSVHRQLRLLRAPSAPSGTSGDGAPAAPGSASAALTLRNILPAAPGRSAPRPVGAFQRRRGTESAL